MNGLLEFAQLGGTVFTVVAFLFYLKGKDEMNKKTYTEFNQTINNHLSDSKQVIKENSKALSNVAVNLKVLSMTIKKNGRKVRI